MSDTPNSTALGHYPHPREDGEITELQLAICRRIMEGESVRKIARDEGMPCRSTVLNWLARDPAFRTAYLFAKQLQAEVLFEEAIEIADDASGDWVDTPDGKVFDKEHVQRAKLRVDTRKWAAGKLAPKRYGEAALLRIDDAQNNERREYSAEDIAVRLAAIATAALARQGK